MHTRILPLLILTFFTTAALADSPPLTKLSVDEMRTSIDKDPAAAIPKIGTWVNSLRAAKLYAEAADIAERGIKLKPGGNAFVVPLQSAQIHSLLDAGKLDDALAAISKYGFDASGRAGEFIAMLMAAKHPREAADLAQKIVLLTPQDLATVEGYQKLRIRALLEAGQAKEALANAKGLYNVSSMLGTTDAILSLTECLAAAYPEDKTMLGRFKAQQQAGATTQPSSQPTDAGASVMASIEVDPKPYEEALQKRRGEDFNTLLARGNLLLLADKAREARPLFERAYALSADNQLPQASEAIARLMKAEDGTIGRANAWVLSIRPKR
ncbi:MAG TPA: hypothetical protein VIL86_13680 [Tepidisphaeraceae bacterium]|jgi:tetratricopeptide (TPR) repeat protein